MSTPTPTPTPTPTDGVPHVRRHPRRQIIALLTALVLVISGVAGGLFWNHHLTAQARTAYTSALQDQAQARNDLDSAVSAAQATVTDSEGKVDDDTVRTTLQDLLTQAGELSVPAALDTQTASRSDLNEATTQATTLTQTMTTLTERITDQASTVTSAVQARALADAKTSVKDAITKVQASAKAARSAIDASSGKVADDQVRVDAETARTTGLTRITEARKLLTGDDAQALQAMAGTLAEANSDIAAKTKAVTDAQGAWQQAQDAAAAAAQATTQAPSSQTSSGDAYSDQTSSTGSGGSWTLAPSGGGSGEGSSSTGGNGFPQTVTDPDGHVHHQITPDPDGSYTDDLGNF